MSFLSPQANLEDKLRCNLNLQKYHFLFSYLIEFFLVSFRMFDLDNDGTIDKEELYQMLKASLFDNPQIQLSEEDMRAVVDNTFNEVDSNGDGRISYDEYCYMVKQRPSFVDYLTVQIIPDEEENDLIQILSSPVETS